MGKIALGSVQFGLDYGIANVGGRTSKAEVQKILSFAKNNSVDLIDTAFAYGDSERVLGMAGINDFNLVTKTASLNHGVDHVLQAFQTSLGKLKVESVYGLLIHDINDIYHKSFDSLLRSLHALKSEGSVTKIGFSTYTPGQVDYLLANFDFDLIQVPFNVFDRRLIEGRQLQSLSKRCVEIHSRSTFLQGALLSSTENRHPFFGKWDALFNSWDNWLDKQSITHLQAALGFALAEDLIDKVVVGVDSADHFLEIIAASRLFTQKVPFNISSVDESLLNPSLWDT